MKLGKIFLLFVIFIYHLGLASIDNLKGTYSILKDEYKHLSLIHGAIAEEKGYLMRLYDYGTLGVEKDYKGQAGAIHKVPDVTNAPAVVKLVHLFFHRNPGHNSSTDFVLTLKLLGATPEEKQKIVCAIACMIGVVEKAKKNIEAYKKILTALKEIRQPAAQSIGDAEFEQLKYLEDFKGKIIDVLKNGATAEGWFSLKNFLKLVFESSEQEMCPAAIFPTYTTNTVLLGVVYRVAGDDKLLMRKFYEKLNETIGVEGSIFVGGQIPATWEAQRFDSDQAARSAVQTMDADKIEEVINNFENIVYLSFVPSENYPILSTYKKVHYRYDKLNPELKISFSDCMENTFRNFYNILFYEKLTFNLERIPDLQIKQEMRDFYRFQSKATTVGNQEFNDAWTNVIENIPFVAYNRKVGTDQSADMLGVKGFIKIPNDVSDPEKFNSDYRRVAQNEIVYEIQPSLKNIIIATNYLLGLNLFNEEKIDGENNKISQALLRGDFIKQYFPKMCEKLKIRLLPWDAKIGDVDKNDYTYTSVITTLIVRLEEPDIVFMTDKTHGEISVLIREDRSTIMTEKLLKIKDLRLYTLPYLNLRFIDPSALNTFFWLPIEDPVFVRDVIRFISNLKSSVSLNALKLLSFLISKEPDDYIKQVLNVEFKIPIVLNKEWDPKLGLAGFPNSTASDVSNVASLYMRDNAKLIRKLTIDLFNALFKKREGFNEGIKTAVAQMRSEARDIRDSAIDLFLALFENEKGFDEGKMQAVEIGKKAAEKMKERVEKKGNGDSWEIRSLTMRANRLFNGLISKFQGVDEAIEVADLWAQRRDILGLDSAIDLFAILVNGGSVKALDKAIEVAKMRMREITIRHDRDPAKNLYISVLEKYGKLVEQGEKLDEALNAAQTGVYSYDPEIKDLAKKLFEILVEKVKSLLLSKTPPSGIVNLCKSVIFVGMFFDEDEKKLDEIKDLVKKVESGKTD